MILQIRFLVRYELKYYLDNKDHGLFNQVINEHPAGFTKCFPCRSVNNIYLDSPDLDSWHETQHGLSVRRKYRIRWYGDWKTMHQPSLEIKIKENQLGTKEIYPLERLQWNGIKDEIEQLKDQYHLPDHLIISSTNRYKRSYFESHCGLYRITIDRDLKFGSGFMDFLLPEFPTNRSVMELKYDLLDDDDSDWIKQFIPFQRSKFSKYVNSMGII